MAMLFVTCYVSYMFIIWYIYIPWKLQRLLTLKIIVQAWEMLIVPSTVLEPIWVFSEREIIKLQMTTFGIGRVILNTKSITGLSVLSWVDSTDSCWLGSPPVLHMHEQIYRDPLPALCSFSVHGDYYWAWGIIHDITIIWYIIYMTDWLGRKSGYSIRWPNNHLIW